MRLHRSQCTFRPIPSLPVVDPALAKALEVHPFAPKSFDLKFKELRGELILDHRRSSK